MKKFITLTLTLLLIFLSACTTAPGKDFKPVDSKTQAVSNYIDSRTYLEYLLLVQRAENAEDKLDITIGFKSVEIYKLGQLITDCVAATKAALEKENEKLNCLFLIINFQEQHSVMWTSFDLKTGYIVDSIHPDISGEKKSVEELMTYYSSKNKNLADIKPVDIVDYYKELHIDTSNLPPEYMEMSDYINKQIPKARVAYVEKGEIDPEKIEIQVYIYRETSHDLGEIAKQAVEATKHAMTLTSCELEQLTILYYFLDKSTEDFTDLQWATSGDFTEGYIWDTRNPDLIPSDGREMSYEEVISFYTPQNKDLK